MKKLLFCLAIFTLYAMNKASDASLPTNLSQLLTSNSSARNSQSQLLVLESLSDKEQKECALCDTFIENDKTTCFTCTLKTKIKNFFRKLFSINSQTSVPVALNRTNAKPIILSKRPPKNNSDHGIMHFLIHRISWCNN